MGVPLDGLAFPDVVPKFHVTVLCPHALIVINALKTKVETSFILVYPPCFGVASQIAMRRVLAERVLLTK